MDDEVFESIEHQKQLLAQAKSRQGQRPDDRKSTEQVFSDQMMAFATLDIRKASESKTKIYQSFVPPSYLPCITPLVELQPILIKDLKLEIQHRGRYLMLRSIAPPLRMTAVTTAMEDENGDATLLMLYQQDHEWNRAANDIIPWNTPVIVKEPYYKITADGGYALRVDHLSDCYYLDKNDPRVPEAWRPPLIEKQSAYDLKLKGNAAFKKGEYWDAIKEYSLALNQAASEEQVEIIKLNRAQAYLKTKQYDAALSDIGYPKFRLPEKALIRTAKALYQLTRLTECREVLRGLCASFPNNPQAAKTLERVTRRWNEQEKGEYDFRQLQASAKILRPPHLDHATYIGPLEVERADNKGRGLFLTRAVKAGELLLCEKAFAHAYAAEGEEVGFKITLLVNTETNRATIGTQAHLITECVQMIYRNPSLAHSLTILHQGSYETTNTTMVDDQPVVDTFLVDRIVSLNAFGCPRSSLEMHNGTAPVQDQNEKGYHSSGIWRHASLINHNCSTTAYRSFIGDMMIVRATRDLEPGSEVTFWYHTPLGKSNEELQGQLSHWGFVCDCVVCIDAKSTNPLITLERQKIRANLMWVLESTSATDIADKAFRLIMALENTYTKPATEVPRLMIWDSHLILARVYAAQERMMTCLVSLDNVLTSLGFIIAGLDWSATRFRVIQWGLFVDDMVDIFLLARHAFRAIGAKEDSECAEEYAKTAYKIVVGEDTTFHDTYG